MSFGQFQFRRDTAANWTSANPILLAGELGLETGTNQFKIGNGTSTWTALAYGGLSGSSGTNGRGITSIVRTSGTGAAGTTDTYTITYTDSTTSTFNVVNGATYSNATVSTAGLMSSNDKKKVDNMYYDVTNYGLVGDDSTDNVTAWNALYAILPVNAVVFFPPGTYRFASELTLSSNLQLLIKGAGKNRSILKATTSTTANLFRFSIAAYYYAFEDLGFTTNVTKTAGAAIQSSFDNALMDIRRCDFQNQFIAVDWSGVGSGNVGSIVDCNFSNPKPNGFQIRINGANINTMIYGTTINCTGINAIGIEINQSGAVQITECDIIGGANCLRVNATGVVSAIYCTNVFFDQATLGTTVKFMGTSAISRIKFTTCGITTGAANLAALEIAGTGSGTGIPEAIDFLQCDFYNNGFTGTTTGLLITGIRGIDIRACRVAGFTVGIDITPYSANDVTNFNITDNTIGPTENFAGNGTGIRINAGSFQYGKSQVKNNDLSGNTGAGLIDNGTYTSGALLIVGNIGLTLQPKPLVATPATIAAVETVVHQVALPANSLLVGTTVKVIAMGIMTATTPTLLARLRLGGAGTTADTQVCATPATAVATGTGWMVETYVTVRSIGAGGTALGNAVVLGTAPGKSAQTATVAVDTTAARFLSLTLIGGGTTPVITVVQAHAEIVRQ